MKGHYDDQVIELLEDMAEFWKYNTPIHAGSDIATNALSLLRVMNKARQAENDVCFCKIPESMG